MLGLIAALALAAPTADAERAAISAVLDDFHAAAAAADEPRYFNHFAPDGVFLGTDPGERWTVDAFRAYAHPHFAAGKGWTYVSRARHITLGPGGVAWFDEVLDNVKYGACRGSGVVEKVGGEWKIASYSLTFLIPNALAEQATGLARASSALKP